MSATPFIDHEFLKKVTEIIEENVSNEQFGVSELAREMGMSRSNLLRKIKKQTHLSVSLFIRQVRLKQSMELLKQTSLNVSEVAFKVGFSSTSYFIKCFREYYGYPPGEAGKREPEASSSEEEKSTHKNHQLAAIMFTDIEGYTALMQRDEAKAVAFRNRHREIFNAAIAKFNGRILQYYGDGTLSTFTSAIDAVKCGIEMQLAYREEPQIPVRIGIHSGDIIFTEDDIIGDGVNVASRIESLSTVGSVFISEKVYDEVKNQPGIYTTSMGVFELKNVNRPLEVFAITNKGLVVPEKAHSEAKVKRGWSNEIAKQNTGRNRVRIIWIMSILLLMVAAYLIFGTGLLNKSKQRLSSANQNMAVQSIAVLPFLNDSYDSSNVYIINGLMESILNNLQKIKNLRVVSRTSVEKFRGSSKTIPEIAEELNVNYVIEGSGQKIGEQIMLSIQLIDATGDQHLWSQQYNREVRDIFALQSEVAKNIADQIDVIISPEVEQRIDKVPTYNLVAYDYYLKGLDLYYKGNAEDLKKGLSWFKKAVHEDEEFAAAWANLAIGYYYLDIFRSEKLFSDSINIYANKALQNDPELSQGLLAKGLFYINKSENELAVPYLEKALEFNPNSAFILNTLSDFYNSYMPDTEKYLEYALKGIHLDIGANDSGTASFIYLHVSNALIQSGFTEEALKYVNKSLQMNPDNLYSQYVKAYILYAKNQNLEQTKAMMLEVLEKDTNRLDILQETGKVFYFLRDYKTSYKYYKRFIDIREAQQLNIYPGEDAKIAVVLEKMGHKEESEQYFAKFREFAENDPSIYKPLSLTAYYAYHNETKRALEAMKQFAAQSNFQYWIILFLDVDPLMDNVKDLPEFKKIFNELKNNFWENHNRIRKSLEEQSLI
ncbi:MAG: helix-turn-helix domain-containing protein [Bacteroidetes bacterium]|nr:helix-turn-helix domain-containing protein [Bacteroidota bacterium]